MFFKIFIPTWNRADKLQGSLTTLLHELNASSFRDDLVVTVRDNASTDSTESVLEECSQLAQRLGVNFQFVINPQNIGFGGSIREEYIATNQQYLLFLSDDDLLIHGSLERYLLQIQQHSPGVAMANFIQGSFSKTSPQYVTTKCFAWPSLDPLQSIVDFPKLSGITLRIPQTIEERLQSACLIEDIDAFPHVSLVCQMYDHFQTGLQSEILLATVDHDFEGNIRFLSNISTMARRELKRALAKTQMTRDDIDSLVNSIEERDDLQDTISSLWSFYLGKKPFTIEMYKLAWSFLGHAVGLSPLRESVEKSFNLHRPTTRQRLQIYFLFGIRCMLSVLCLLHLVPRRDFVK